VNSDYKLYSSDSSFYFKNVIDKLGDALSQITAWELNYFKESPKTYSSFQNLQIEKLKENTLSQI